MLKNSLGVSFKHCVYEVVRNIKKGEVLTYKEVATLAGRPLAYRAVGNILNNNYDEKIPCHRVVRSNGLIGGYNRGGEEKLKRLRQEGAII
ncbi:MAG: MGMT family protein [Candidatus Paceibacterota bacterium]|jgi:O-6-methylguanine DNA methyltransferase